MLNVAYVVLCSNQICQQGLIEGQKRCLAPHCQQQQLVLISALHCRTLPYIEPQSHYRAHCCYRAELSNFHLCLHQKKKHRMPHDPFTGTVKLKQVCLCVGASDAGVGTCHVLPRWHSSRRDPEHLLQIHSTRGGVRGLGRYHQDLAGWP